MADFCVFFRFILSFLTDKKILMCVYDYDYRKFERRFFTC